MVNSLIPAVKDAEVEEHLCCPNVCPPAPMQGSTATEANQLGSYVREWDRAVALRLDNAVVLAAHRLCIMNETTGVEDISLVCAVTGVPVPAGKALQALTDKIKNGKGGPRLKVEEVSEFAHQFKQANIRPIVETLVAGRDWDELRGDFVPCLSYANKAFSWNPKRNLCTGSEASASVSQAVVDNLYNSQMSIDDAKDVALQAMYFAAISGQELEGHEFESVDVCVITAKGIEITHHSVEELHAKYAPLEEERKRRFAAVPI